MDAFQWHKIAAVSGIAALGLGTYGFHIFKPENPVYKEVWQIASTYHLFHTAALLSAPITKRPHIFGGLLTAGILSFSGSNLYLVAKRIFLHIKCLLPRTIFKVLSSVRLTWTPTIEGIVPVLKFSPRPPRRAVYGPRRGASQSVEIGTCKTWDKSTTSIIIHTSNTNIYLESCKYLSLLTEPPGEPYMAYRGGQGQNLTRGQYLKLLGSRSTTQRTTLRKLLPGEPIPPQHY
ncbi:hypothetical protein GOBAR_DD09567 [Gossypium barbadense]|nr:hypothetical protein GOBAR_DD09567 [Gossypium barbadense]